MTGARASGLWHGCQAVSLADLGHYICSTYGLYTGRYMDPLMANRFYERERDECVAMITCSTYETRQMADICNPSQTSRRTGGDLCRREKREEDVTSADASSVLWYHAGILTRRKIVST